MANSYQQEPIEDGDRNTERKFNIGPKAESNKSSQEKEVKSSPEKAVEKPLQKIEKEAPKEVIKAEKDSAYGKILSKVKNDKKPIPSDDEVKTDAKISLEKTDTKSQVQQLVDLAETKGVAHAVKVAKHMDDNYVLDMFHDKLLSSELHDALVKKGLISEK